ncbi:ANR family transcriptional regulator [Ursidibacter arcticus]
MKQKFDGYKHYSQAASKAERAGDYAQALQYWQKAEDATQNIALKAWCRNRVMFLNRWGERMAQRDAQQAEQVA